MRENIERPIAIICQVCILYPLNSFFPGQFNSFPRSNMSDVDVDNSNSTLGLLANVTANSIISDSSGSDVVEDEDEWVKHFRFGTEGVAQGIVGLVGLVGKI